MTTLSAEDLRGIQGSEIVLSIRMADVRKWYIAAVFFMTVSVFAGMLALIELYVAIPATLVVTAVVAHAIHSDHETAFHFEKVTGVRLRHMRFEYSLDTCESSSAPERLALPKAPSQTPSSDGCTARSSKDAADGLCVQAGCSTRRG